MQQGPGKNKGEVVKLIQRGKKIDQNPGPGQTRKKLHKFEHIGSCSNTRKKRTAGENKRGSRITMDKAPTRKFKILE